MSSTTFVTITTWLFVLLCCFAAITKAQYGLTGVDKERLSTSFISSLRPVVRSYVSPQDDDPNSKLTAAMFKHQMMIRGLLAETQVVEKLAAVFSSIQRPSSLPEPPTSSLNKSVAVIQRTWPAVWLKAWSVIDQSGLQQKLEAVVERATSTSALVYGFVDTLHETDVLNKLIDAFNESDGLRRHINELIRAVLRIYLDLTDWLLSSGLLAQVRDAMLRAGVMNRALRVLVETRVVAKYNAILQQTDLFKTLCDVIGEKQDDVVDWSRVASKFNAADLHTLNVEVPWDDLERVVVNSKSLLAGLQEASTALAKTMDSKMLGEVKRDVEETVKIYQQGAACYDKKQRLFDLTKTAFVKKTGELWDGVYSFVKNGSPALHAQQRSWWLKLAGLVALAVTMCCCCFCCIMQRRQRERDAFLRGGKWMPVASSRV